MGSFPLFGRSKFESVKLLGFLSPQTAAEALHAVVRMGKSARVHQLLVDRIASRNFVTECLMNDVTGGGQAWCVGQYFIDLEPSTV